MRTSITPRTRRGRWSKSMVAIVAGAALAMSACGGDDDDDSGDDTNASEEDNSSDSAGSDDDSDSNDSEDDSAETDEPGDDTDDAADEDSDDSGAGDSGEYCDVLKKTGEDLTSSDSQEGDLAGAYQKIVDVAPDDIKDDWQTIADAMKAMEDIDMSDPDAAEQMEEIGDIEQVTTRVTSHVKDNCDDIPGLD